MKTMFAHKGWKYYNKNLDFQNLIDKLEERICEEFSKFKSELQEALAKDIECWESQVHEVILEMREDLMRSIMSKKAMKSIRNRLAELYKKITSYTATEEEKKEYDELLNRYYPIDCSKCRWLKVEYGNWSCIKAGHRKGSESLSWHKKYCSGFEAKMDSETNFFEHQTLHKIIRKQFEIKPLKERLKMITLKKGRYEDLRRFKDKKS